MSTKYPELWAALMAPFHADSVYTRDAPGGRRLSYITARTAMNRLDEVLGPENWDDAYAETKDGLTCTITARLPGGEVVSKSDGGGFTEMGRDADDTEKTGYSSAFKRAAVKFGVGRYLYDDGVPDFCLAGYARPDSPPPARPAAPPPRPCDGKRASRAEPPGTVGGKSYGPPKTGKALWAHLSQHRKDTNEDLVPEINRWAKEEGLPFRMTDWNEVEVAKCVETFGLGG